MDTEAKGMYFKGII